MGANAVVAMRYDANEIAAAVTEVLAYGSAVIIEPVGGLGAGFRGGRGSGYGALVGPRSGPLGKKAAGRG